MGKTFDFGVFDVTPEQLAAMPKLRYNNGVSPLIGDYIVVYTSAMYGYWCGDVAVCMHTYETLQAAVDFASWVDNQEMSEAMYEGGGICSEQEIWHIVSGLDLEALLDSRHEKARKETVGLLYRSYDCRCFAWQSDVNSHVWDEPDDFDCYVGELGLHDLAGCSNFAKRVTAAGILPQVEIWADVRMDGHGYDCWEHVRVCTYRNGVIVDRGC